MQVHKKITCYSLINLLGFRTPSRFSLIFPPVLITLLIIWLPRESFPLLHCRVVFLRRVVMMVVVHSSNVFVVSFVFLNMILLYASLILFMLFVKPFYSIWVIFLLVDYFSFILLLCSICISFLISYLFVSHFLIISKEVKYTLRGIIVTIFFIGI